MTQDNGEAPPALDEGDENPDQMAGEPVEPEHDLDPDDFEDEDEGGQG